jgi:hypothetical protein
MQLYILSELSALGFRLFSTVQITIWKTEWTPDVVTKRKVLAPTANGTQTVQPVANQCSNSAVQPHTFSYLELIMINLILFCTSALIT